MRLTDAGREVLGRDNSVRVVSATRVEKIRALRGDLDRLSHRQIAWLVFLTTLCVYFFLTPYVLRDWWPTGDEPHCLLVSHSIVTDGDFRLANNYEEKDFLAFYIADDLNPFLQTAKGSDGNLYPIRGPGFSLLLAPAYFLGGRAGVAFFLDLVGGLLAMNFYLLGYEVTRSRLAPLVAWVFVFFTPLLALYNFLLYPEVVGGLVLLLALRTIRGTVEETRTNRGGARDWLLIGFLIAFLPWLSNRFVPFGGILFISALACGWREHDKIFRRQAMIYLLAPCIGSALLYSAYNYSLFGNLSPLAAYDIAGHNVSGHLLQTPLTDVGVAMLGWLLDPRRGLFIYAPVYVLSLPGILLLLRQKRREAFLLLPYPTIAYLYTSWTGLYFPGWEISPKFMVSVMPILGIFMAHAFTVIKRLSFRTMALALLVIGLTSARHIIFIDPQAPYEKTIVAKFNRWDRFDVNRYLPHFVLDFFLPGHLGFAGVGTLIKDDELRGSLPLPRFRERIQSVIHTSTDPEDEGYAFIADLGKDLDKLPRGAYEAYWFLKIGDNTSQATVAIIDVLDPEGEIISKKEIIASDFEESGTYQRFTLPFDYPLEAADRGEPILRLFSTARADLWIVALEIGAVTVIPPWPLATLWLGIIGIFSAYYCLRPGRKPLALPRPQLRAAPVGAKERSVLFPVMTAGLVLLITVSLGNYLLSTGYPRVFEAESLRRLTGEVVADEDASAGKAAHASVGDPESMLIYGPYEFFPPGRYVAKFRMKIGGTTEAAIPVVSIDAYGAGSGVLAERSLLSSDFKEVHRYRTFHLRFRNPVQQALQFRVYFPGVADLWVDKITLEKLEVVERQRNFALPSPDHPLEARLGEMVRLLGYDLEGDGVGSGEEIGLTLYWQALAPADRPYKVFTHLIDEENVIWGQHDSQPVGGTYPPNLWVAGEVVADSYRLPVAAEAPGGIYRLEVGMYYEPTGERLPVYIEGERVEEERILSGEIEVVK